MPHKNNSCPPSAAATDWDAYYKRAFPTSLWSRAVVRKKLASLLLSCGLPLDGSARILEAGGGNSCFYETVAKTLHPREYAVLDQHAYSLELLEKKLQKRSDLVQASLYKDDILRPSALTPFAGKFDLVFSVGLIEHFSEQDMIRAVQFHLSCAKPGGFVLLFFPTPTWMYRLVRKTAEVFHLWIFHDERPILLKTISSLISEDQGHILKQGILYSMILTQAYVLIRRRN